MSRTSRWSIAALLVLATFAAPEVARAQDEVIPPKVLVRKFPEGVFCALPISMTFIAPTDPVIVTFTAIEWVDEGAGGLQWTQQLIDNVTVSPTADVTPNIAPPPVGSSAEFCYIGDPQPTPYFHFNRAGLVHNLLERFDTAPSVNPWLLTDGAYFDGAHTAARNVEDVSDATGGSLGLGNGLGTPTAGHTASTSITLDNLNQGVSYDLGAWWFAGHVHFPHDIDYLTVTITTLGGVPVARRSWGSLKQVTR